MAKSKTTADTKAKPQQGVVEEAYVSYARVETNFNNGANTGLLAFQHRPADKPVNHMTPFEKINWAKEGVSKEELQQLKQYSGMDYDQLAKALSVARATLISKKKEQRFNASLSEKIIGLADILAYGHEVFEDEQKFNQWIYRPNTALGGQTPFDFMDSHFGREEVKKLLGRIDYGVYS